MPVRAVHRAETRWAASAGRPITPPASITYALIGMLSATGRRAAKVEVAQGSIETNAAFLLLFCLSELRGGSPHHRCFVPQLGADTVSVSLIRNQRTADRSNFNEIEHSATFVEAFFSIERVRDVFAATH